MSNTIHKDAESSIVEYVQHNPNVSTRDVYTYTLGDIKVTIECNRKWRYKTTTVDEMESLANDICDAVANHPKRGAVSKITFTKGDDNGTR